MTYQFVTSTENFFMTSCILLQFVTVRVLQLVKLFLMTLSSFRHRILMTLFHCDRENADLDFHDQYTFSVYNTKK